MLKIVRGDMHIHTCLSPCGDKDMLPGNIVKEAKNKGLDFIGICDHNSVENVFAVKNRGRKEGLEVLGGIEITSSEEVHILAFFDGESSLLKIGEIVYKNLSPKENEPDFFGEQLVSDEYDRIIRNNNKLLIGATSLKLEEIVDIVHNLGGLAIASHVDRTAFGIIGQLGFIPEGLRLDAIELSPNYNRSSLDIPRNFPQVFSSDAHRLDDIGTIDTPFFLEKPTLSEIKKAFLNQDNRRIVV